MIIIGMVRSNMRGIVIGRLDNNYSGARLKRLRLHIVKVVFEISKMWPQEMRPRTWVEGEERQAIMIDAPRDLLPLLPIKQNIVAGNQTGTARRVINFAGSAKRHGPVWLRTGG